MSAELRNKLQAQAALKNKIRLFFAQRGVLEVRTPLLADSAGTDASIEPLSLQAQLQQPTQLYLQTSPEFHMKQLLMAGSGDIYQICPAFRDGEQGPWHRIEFEILEWYRLGYDHHQLMNELVELVQFCAGQSLPVQRIRYLDLFKEYIGCNPLAMTAEQLAEQARALGLDIIGDLDKNDWLDLILSHRIQPELQDLTLIYDYPAEQAALARLNPDDPRWAHRFELYYRGVELANGYHELNDAAEQRRRFQQDNQLRRQRGQRIMPLPESFLKAMAEYGLPDCAGVAMGLDRLFMLLLGLDHLDQLLINFQAQS